MMRQFRMLVLASVAAGCAVGPSYHPEAGSSGEDAGGNRRLLRLGSAVL